MERVLLTICHSLFKINFQTYRWLVLQFESYNHTELCPDWTNYLWYLFIKIRFDYFFIKWWYYILSRIRLSCLGRLVYLLPQTYIIWFYNLLTTNVPDVVGTTIDIYGLIGIFIKWEKWSTIYRNIWYSHIRLHVYRIF
jgi:hypothetical protein